MNTAILEQVIEQLKVMPQDLQCMVLEFARTLAGSKIQGVPGSQLLEELLELMSIVGHNQCQNLFL